ncbi:crotonobetainyl-CoA:carnitine CoA-transferase CaiB-like acyl-CoA transferase [Nocardia kruczakiae]|uniref:Crotonobetainyl-CoA:carnitine CoA-transferase CaiB-like acyl-CoA transferase n=1 Tax=Nocardia kruczakiae TaxID=261477 RepID=A0ABU1XB51_9NOCA|nr:CoA transferase [Nocardia kruczakiae]MDR7167306.1 crotonobetainyl-CoA:carnitine CoA-transferase CaiB-like acyl-CoA transferase [Nocardia kruczakiae]
MDTQDGEGPLTGLRVVDLSTTAPGGQATQFLADAGADVVLVEPPGGSPMRASAAWPAMSGGKRSIVIDIRDDDGRAELDRLLAGADVCVTTMRPATLARRVLTGDRLAALNPRLVSCAITGFGMSGPWADLPGYEALVMAKLGMFHAKANMVERPGPAFVSVPNASWGAAQTAVHGILAALLDRESTGRGQHVEADLVRGVSMIDAWNWFGELVGIRWPDAYRTVAPYTEDGELLSQMSYSLLAAPTKDGRFLQFAQTGPRLFVAMLEEFGLGSLLTDPKWKGIPKLESQALRTELWEIMLEKVGERTLAEWQRVFETNPNVSAELFRRGPEALDHPQLQWEGRDVVIDDPEYGRVRRPGALVHVGGRPFLPPRPAPRLDEHGAEIRAGLAEATGASVAADVPPSLPLAGVTIVDFGVMFASPFGSTQLTDLGARVIKVEALSGDTVRNVLPFPESGGARVMQGKESIAVDLHTDEGLRIVHELARRADVVLQSFRAGAAERAGIGYDALRAINPDLIYVNAPGYGVGGPYGHRPAYAPSISAAVGLALTDAPGATRSVHTLEEKKSAMRQFNSATAVPSLQADGLAALSVASTILLGLLARQRSRLTGALTVTMLATGTHVLLDRLVDFPGRPQTPEVDDDCIGWNALYRMYRAADGWVCLAAPAAKDWAPLTRALADEIGLADDPRFATPADRTTHDRELGEVLAQVFAHSPAAEWEQRLLNAGVGCVQVTEAMPENQIQTKPELAAEYAGTATSTMFEEHLRFGPSVKFSRSTTQTKGGCLAGEHTDAILKEIGYDTEVITDLRGRQIIA